MATLLFISCCWENLEAERSGEEVAWVVWGLVEAVGEVRLEGREKETAE